MAAIFHLILNLNLYGHWPNISWGNLSEHMESAHNNIACLGQGLIYMAQGRTGHRKSDQPGHKLTQPSPAQWPSKTHWAGLGQDDFVRANELAILTYQVGINKVY